MKQFHPLKRKLARLGLAAEPWTDQEEIDPDRPMLVPNRSNKRAAKQYNRVAGTTPTHDVLRLGPSPKIAKKTGQPHWFRVMKYEAARRKALEKVSLDRLEPAVGRIALDLYHAGYENVWQVTQVEDVNTFLKHGRYDGREHGIRADDLKKLRTYLIKQQVPVKWEV